VQAIRTSVPNSTGFILYDARPKAAAIANHAKGAGYEDTTVGYPKVYRMIQSVRERERERECVCVCVHGYG
jgi:xanthine/CO dehydrogenase XdhC/CoxF family maturation factor